MKNFHADVARTATALLDLFLPRICIACGRPLALLERHLCLFCLADLPRTGYAFQSRNGMADRFNALLQADLPDGVPIPPYVRCTALFYYRGEGGYNRLTQRLKYHADLSSGRFLSGRSCSAACLPAPFARLQPGSRDCFRAGRTAWRAGPAASAGPVAPDGLANPSDAGGACGQRSDGLPAAARGPSAGGSTAHPFGGRCFHDRCDAVCLLPRLAECLRAGGPDQHCHTGLCDVIPGRKEILMRIFLFVINFFLIGKKS